MKKSPLIGCKRQIKLASTRKLYLKKDKAAILHHRTPTSHQVVRSHRTPTNHQVARVHLTIPSQAARVHRTPTNHQAAPVHRTIPSLAAQVHRTTPSQVAIRAQHRLTPVQALALLRITLNQVLHLLIIQSQAPIRAPQPLIIPVAQPLTNPVVQPLIPLVVLPAIMLSQAEVPLIIQSLAATRAQPIPSLATLHLILTQRQAAIRVPLQLTTQVVHPAIMPSQAEVPLTIQSQVTLHRLTIQAPATLSPVKVINMVDSPHRVTPTIMVAKHTTRSHLTITAVATISSMALAITNMALVTTNMVVATTSMAEATINILITQLVTDTQSWAITTMPITVKSTAIHPTAILVRVHTTAMAQ